MKKSVFGIKSFRSGLAIGLTSLILAACGGGGGGGGNDPQAGSPEPVQVSVSGSVVKGHISGGTVSVYRILDNGVLGDLITSVQTDENGEYALRLTPTELGPDRLVALVITGGQYIDEATGNVVVLGSNDRLETYVRVPSSGEVSVNVTPLTTLAAAMVRQLIISDSKDSIGEAITYATTHISDRFDITNVDSVAIPTLNGLSEADPSQRNYALLLAGFSQLDANDIDKNVFEILATMVADMEADGVLGNDATAPAPGQLVLAVNQFLADRTDLNDIDLSNKVYKKNNIAPIAQNDEVTVEEDGSITISVLENDSDANSSDTLEIIAVNTDGISGEAKTTDGQTIVYTPPANFNGDETFSYTVKDSHNDTAEAQVVVTVTPVNDAPVARADSINVIEDDEDGVEAMLRADDAENDDLEFGIVREASKGDVSLDITSGEFTYTPHRDASGQDSFTFMANDGVANSEEETITIEIVPVGDKPVANDSVFNTIEDAGPETGKLDARDVDGDTLVYSLFSSPEKGQVEINSATGTYVYTPHANEDGIDEFEFFVLAGDEQSNTATVRVSIEPVNDTPVTTSSHLDVVEETVAGSNLIANDVDDAVLTYSIVEHPTKGSVQITNLQSGSFVYTPNEKANGDDSFTFKANDGKGDSNISVITIAIEAVNDVPVATDGELVTTEDTSVVGQLVATDEDDVTLTYSLVTEPAKGSVELVDAETGEFIYTPNENENGVDVFSFRANDGAEDSNTALIQVTINAENDAPTTVNDTASTDEDTPLVLPNESFNLLANDSDLEGDDFSIVSVAPIEGMTNGTVALVDGQVIYTPDEHFNGTAQFTYTVEDDADTPKSSSATVTVDVASIQDRPLADNANFNVVEDTVDNVGELTGSDPDGDDITFSLWDGVSKVDTMTTTLGEVTLTDPLTGAFTFTPNPDAVGDDSFSFRVSDGVLDSEVATIEISVVDINDAPIAETKTINVLPNTGITGRLFAEDADNDQLTFEIATDGTKGNAIISATGEFSYTNDWSGNATTDSFTYRVTDARGKSVEGTINVEIEPLPSSVMFIVAHPNNEALMGAGTIQRFVDNNVPVKVVVVTNGDFRSVSQGHLREDETVAAMAELGVAEDDIIFLGYPDDATNGGLREIYNNHPTSATSYVSNITGKSVTYGSRGLGNTDFHSHREGFPGQYNKANMLSDLEILISRYQPEQIYTHSIADEHPDQRIVYHFVTDALSAVMKDVANYQADVYTSIVHSPKNFPFTHTRGGALLADKWPSDVFPARNVFEIDLFEDYEWPLPAFAGSVEGVDTVRSRFTPDQPFSEPSQLMFTPYLWEERVAKFVPADMQSTFLASNPKYTVFEAYQSGHAGHGWLHAFGKNDEIFWRHDWSSNIALRANISASSQSEATVQIAQNVADGIIDGRSESGYGYHQAEWVTEANVGKDASLTMTWPRDYLVSELRFYDRPLLDRNIISATVTLSDGSSHQLSSLPAEGYTPAVIELDPPRVINSLTFTIDSASSGGEVGLAEIEVIGEEANVANRSPFFTSGPVASDYVLGYGEVTTLSVEGTDVDGDEITYAWSASAGTITGSGTSVQYEAPSDSAIVDVVTVSVSDGVSSSSTQFAINLLPPNIAGSATITTSSEQLDNAGTKAVDGVVGGWPDAPLNEWATDGEDWTSIVSQGDHAWIDLDWGQEVEIATILLHDRPNSNDQITSGRLLFSDGSIVNVDELPNDGSEFRVNFSARTVSSVRFFITGVSFKTVHTGLAEILVLSPTSIEE